MQPINLFEGDIYQLIAELKKLPENKEYLSFASETTFSDMLEKMHNGCPKLTAQYTEQQQGKTFVGTTKTSYQFNTEGVMFDVATYLQGEPEYWLNEVETVGCNAAKDFYINISVPSNVKKEKIFEKLIKVIEIIDQLEANGQRLNIILYACTTNGSAKPIKYNFTVNVKEASQPLNIEQLIYLIASPAMLRYAKLWMQKCSSKIPKNYMPETDRQKEIDLLNTEDLFYIPSIFYDATIGHGTTYKNIDLIELYNLK